MKHRLPPIRPAFFLAFACAILSCSKHPGTAESFGGGDPTLGVLNDKRAVLLTGALALQSGKSAADLCSSELIAAQIPEFFGSDHTVPTQYQAEACRNFLLAAPQSLVTLLSDANDSPVSISADVQLTTGIVIDEPVAATVLGQAGPIIFNAARAAQYSGNWLGIILGHEIAHQLQLQFSPGSHRFVSGPGVRDSDNPEGLTWFMDYVGVSLLALGESLQPNAKLSLAGLVCDRTLFAATSSGTSACQAQGQTCVSVVRSDGHATLTCDQLPSVIDPNDNHNWNATCCGYPTAPTLLACSSQPITPVGTGDVTCARAGAGTCFSTNSGVQREQIGCSDAVSVSGYGAICCQAAATAGTTAPSCQDYPLPATSDGDDYCAQQSLGVCVSVYGDDYVLALYCNTVPEQLPGSFSVRCCH
jgi:hypothetical protein